MLLKIFMALSEKFYDKAQNVGIAKGKCIHNIKGYQCLECVKACSNQGVFYDSEEGIAFNDKCVGCSRCIDACQTGCLTDPLQPGYLRITGKPLDRVDVFCEKESRLFGVKARCIFSLDFSQLLELHSRTGKEINLITCQCHECPKITQQELDSALKKVETFNDILPNPWIHIRCEDSIQPSMELDRKEFFKIIKDTTQNSILESLVPEETGKSLKHILLSAAEDKLNHGKISQLIVGKRFSETCTVCGKCASLCPTNAIKLFQSDKIQKVFFNYLDCIECNRCVNNCTKSGITSESATKHSHKEQIGNVCTVCGALSQTGNICEQCTKKRRV